MEQYTGFTAETPKRLAFDAGAFYRGYVVGTDTPSTATAKLLGATRDGGTFNAVPELRDVPVDGVKGRVQGMKVLEAWDVNMTTSLLEVKPESLTLALGSSTVDTVTDEDYDIIEGKHDITDEDYIDNLTYIGKISGSNLPIIIQIFNVFNSNGLSFTRQDKNEAVIALELQAHYAADELDSPPFKIYYPKAIPTP